MADTATHLPEKVETAAAFSAKAAQIAEVIRKAKHLIVFTGAGISTSCGIPDFRGPTGVWTMRDKGLRTSGGTPIAVARPSFTHMALKTLVDTGRVKAVISQNTDGLHARSGVPLEKLWELHGNSYKSQCWTCGHRQVHKRPVRHVSKDMRKEGGECKDCLKHVPWFCHCTVYACPKCGPATPLRDTIIHFKENLDETVLTNATAAGDTADACLALGSSLTVQPAAGIPETVADNGGKLVVINKQDTPLDSKAAVRVWGSVDDVMSEVMSLLGLEVKEWDEKAWEALRNEYPLTPEGERIKASMKAASASASGGAGGSSSSSTAAAASGGKTAAAAVGGGASGGARSAATGDAGVASGGGTRTSPASGTASGGTGKSSSSTSPAAKGGAGATPTAGSSSASSSTKGPSPASASGSKAAGAGTGKASGTGAGSSSPAGGAKKGGASASGVTAAEMEASRKTIGALADAYASLST